MRRTTWILLTLAALPGLTACDGRGELETRTFQLRYLQPHVVDDLLDPYVYADREGAPGRMSVTEAAVTVRETADNLDRIGRVLEQYDRPRPTVMLHFQVIRADGAAEPDPAIAAVERELRRLFRFDGYRLVADAHVGGVAGTLIRQMVGRGEEQFLIQGGVTEVRSAVDPATVTVDVRLSGPETGPILETGVTVAEGQSVVLGTARAPAGDGALILVVRADVVEPGEAAPGAEAEAGAEAGAAPDG